MSRKQTTIAVVLCAGLCLGATTAESVDVYTDRGTWETAVTTVRMTEDFESETPGVYMTPYQTAGGFNVERGGMFLDLTVRDGGAVDGSREILIQDYAGRAFFTFPANRHQLAFGFDWATGGEAWTLKFLGQDYPLAADSGGFIGLVDADGQSFGFELTSAVETQDGLAIDNLDYSQAVFVYTDRVAWETALGQSVVVEDFEVDAPGDFQTPYTTAGGCELTGLGGPIDLSVVASGLIDGSRELHFRDYGDQLSLRLPGDNPVRGYGFDWKTTQESWSLYARGEYVSLTGTGSGFIGIIDQTGLTEDFVLTSAIVVQQGIRVDNITFPSGTTPVVPTTWGALKGKYR